MARFIMATYYDAVQQDSMMAEIMAPVSVELMKFYSYVPTFLARYFIASQLFFLNSQIKIKIFI